MKNENRQDALLNLDEELLSMRDEVPEMPADFHASWIRAVEDDMNNLENQTPEQSTPATPAKKKFHYTRWISIAAAVAVLIGGTAVSRNTLAPRTNRKMEVNANAVYQTGDYGSSLYGASGNSYKAAGSTNYYAEDVEESYSMSEPTVFMANDSAPAEQAPAREQKIIRTVTLTMGTKNYDDLYTKIRQDCLSFGGWVEYASESSSYSSGLRNVTLTLRIPAEKLDSFIDSFATEGRMIHRSESAQDVSDSYYDRQTRLETQKLLMTRLQSLITDAASLSDLLELERQIADIQYTIDSLQGSLNGTDRQVNYSTIELTLKEETDASDVSNTELTFLQRLSSAFTTGLVSFVEYMEDMAVFAVSALPLLVCVAIAVLVIRAIVRRVRKGKK